MNRFQLFRFRNRFCYKNRTSPRSH